MHSDHDSHLRLSGDQGAAADAPVGRESTAATSKNPDFFLSRDTKMHVRPAAILSPTNLPIQCWEFSWTVWQRFGLDSFRRPIANGVTAAR